MICNTKVKIQLQNDLHTFDVGSYSFVIADKMDLIEDLWKEFSYEDIFFSPDFLKVIEELKELEIKPFYALQMKDGHCIGVFYFQLSHFNLRASLRSNHNQASFDPKAWLSGLVNFDTLIFGNLLLTGNYGCCKRLQSSGQDFDWSDFQNQVLNYLKTYHDCQPSAILAKDFYKAELPAHLQQSGYHTFAVQPNLILNISPKWENFDDYLEDLKAKYRVRYRRALKKMEGLEFRPLTIQDLEVYKAEMHDLYLDIANNAVFNLFTLPQDYFLKLRKALGEKFLVFGCFDINGKMLAFYSCVDNFDHLQAHFLGYDKDANHENQIYLNILYNIIDLGIQLKQEKIILSRTAIEIKTSVGAIPYEMSCLFLHTNSIANKMFGPIFSTYMPAQNFVARSPFREQE